MPDLSELSPKRLCLRSKFHTGHAGVDAFPSFPRYELFHPPRVARALKRTFKQLSRRPMGLELVLIADEISEEGSRAASTEDK